MGISKALMIIWIGVGQSQTLSITPMETIEQCEAAKKAIVDRYTHDWLPQIRNETVQCLPFGLGD